MKKSNPEDSTISWLLLCVQALVVAAGLCLLIGLAVASGPQESLHASEDSASNVRLQQVVAQTDAILHNVAAMYVANVLRGNGKICIDDAGNLQSDGRDITCEVQRLLQVHYAPLGGSIKLREYDRPDDNVLATNSNKGQEIAICVRSKTDPQQLNSINSMVRVLIHELAHSMDHSYVNHKDHGECFYQLERFLVKCAINSVDANGKQFYTCPKSINGKIQFCGKAMELLDVCGGGKQGRTGPCKHKRRQACGRLQSSDIRQLQNTHA